MDFQFPALVVSSCGVLIVKQAIVMNSVASVMNFLVRRTYDERKHCYGKVAIVMKYSTACTDCFYHGTYVVSNKSEFPHVCQSVAIINDADTFTA